MLDKKIYKYSTAKNITSVTFQGFEKTFQEKIYVNLPMPLLEYMFLDENISHKEATLWQLLHGKHIFKEGQFKGTQKQLAECLKIPYPSFRRNIKNLSDAGYLKISHNKTKTGYKASSYTISLPEEAVELLEAAPNRRRSSKIARCGTKANNKILLDSSDQSRAQPLIRSDQSSIRYNKYIKYNNKELDRDLVKLGASNSESVVVDFESSSFKQNPQPLEAPSEIKAEAAYKTKSSVCDNHLQKVDTSRLDAEISSLERLIELQSNTQNPKHVEALQAQLEKLKQERIRAQSSVPAFMGEKQVERGDNASNPIVSSDACGDSLSARVDSGVSLYSEKVIDIPDWVAKKDRDLRLEIAELKGKEDRLYVELAAMKGSEYDRERGVLLDQIQKLQSMASSLNVELINLPKPKKIEEIQTSVGSRKLDSRNMRKLQDTVLNHSVNEGEARDKLAVACREILSGSLSGSSYKTNSQLTVNMSTNIACKLIREGSFDLGRVN